MTTSRKPRAELRADLVAAAERLREVDSPQLAQAVDTVLTFSALQPYDSQADPNLSIRLPKAARDRIVAGAKRDRVSVQAVVNEAFQEFLDGKFSPKATVRERKGTAAEKVNLNVRPERDLMARVAEAGVKPMHVAADYLQRRFKAGPYADDAQAVAMEPGQVRIPKVPRHIREQLRQAAESQVSIDIDEGFQRYLAGQFTPHPPVWSKDDKLVPMKVYPNDDLFARIAEEGPRRPMQVALAYLLTKYGISYTAAE
ncbi:hypothetical protein ACGFU4_36260 [Streptomyces sp. NPDC048511]|uniref:hypothetical protein n=1 Tax=Streptomyces sp. NPDC048511 TaxID=3365562 RepID=UPI00371BD3E8